MSTTATPFDDVRPINRSEGLTLACTENQRMLELLRSLAAEHWSKPTECPGWDVRDMAGHVLGAMENFCSARSLVHMMRAAKKEAGGGSLVDGMTAVQIRERADLTRGEVLDRLAEAGPRSARFRSRMPAPLRALPMKQELLSGETETWKMGYLLDTILTRDTWMHRVDISRATGRELVLTAEHDGRIVEDAASEWARRHGQPCTLVLTGPAGGTFTRGTGGEAIAVDGVEFCRLVSGRGTGAGLLAQEVPF
ncbi:MAG: maleylpyruvate isomerase family mycothiol-dependent enzyme [Nocardioidaceae bacterium]|nr:maleylpyruvate isomerase family mycothiol-dependent enzyme [Nocardioidaceae bacterium]